MRTLGLLLCVIGCGRSSEPAPQPTPTPIPIERALALVFEGSEIWIGNDRVEPDPDARYPGMLPELAAALDRAQPIYGVATAMTYGPVEVIVAMGPATAMTGFALGTQDRYYERRREPVLLDGIEAALGSLEHVTTEARVLVLVGSHTVGMQQGGDTPRTSAIAARARRANVQIRWLATSGEESGGSGPAWLHGTRTYDLEADLSAILRR